MASNDVCEMRLVMAAASTARRKTSNSFQDGNTKRVHVLAILPGRRTDTTGLRIPGNRAL